MRRFAKPWIPVRFWVQPPKIIMVTYIGFLAVNYYAPCQVRKEAAHVLGLRAEGLLV